MALVRAGGTSGYPEARFSIDGLSGVVQVLQLCAGGFAWDGASRPTVVALLLSCQHGHNYVTLGHRP